MRWVMKYLSNFIVGFSEIYHSKHSNAVVKAITSIYNGNKYNLKPELRAERYLRVTTYSDVYFAKCFLNLTEYDLLHGPANMFNAKINVNRLITIAPEPLEIENVHDRKRMVQIPIPSSHLGVGSVTVRLLSNVRRHGMAFKRTDRDIHPTSNCLIFHCHGGGFVAHTSKSHEIYLRDWAAKLQVPILSIDYSLAPQAPYPRALEEIFYAYCWAIKNSHKLLGTTAEKIIVVGDSAGGALNMALTLKCIEQAVRRPDGALLIYCPFYVGFELCPSRLLTTIDVLLPFGLLLRCLKAYIQPPIIPDDEDQFFESPNGKANANGNGNGSATKSTVNVTKNRRRILTDRNLSDDFQFEIPKDKFISSLYANDNMLKQLPPIKFLVSF